MSLCRFVAVPAFVALTAGAPAAEAGLIDDVNECIDKAVQAAWVTAQAGKAIAEMLADPELNRCISQILLPDPLTIRRHRSGDCSRCCQWHCTRSVRSGIARQGL